MTAALKKKVCRHPGERCFISIAETGTIWATAFALVLSGALTMQCAAGESNSVSGTIARNFFEELLSQGGLQKHGEGLGSGGSQHLGLSQKVVQAYAIFAAKLTKSHPFRLVPAARIAENKVYRDLLEKQGSQPDSLVRALARDILEYRPSRPAVESTISGIRNSAIAVVTFVTFNGARGLAYANSSISLVGLRTVEAASLAKSLGADYLISVELAPYIVDYDPMGSQPGTVELFYRVRVYGHYGQVIFDEKIPGDEAAVTGPVRFVAYELPPFTLLKMSIAKALFLFPTDAQREQLGMTESREVSEILHETLEKIAERMTKH
jgi:hypothetical protein